MHAWGGDRTRYELENPHRDPKDLKDWTHECWNCEDGISGACFETDKKVKNGVPYWLLKLWGK